MNAQERKKRPIYSGVLKYFPDALEAVAYTSWTGNEQHNPGEPLHWAREKSTDQLDAALRHLKDYASGVSVDTDGVPHLAKAAWRILAELQLYCECEAATPPATDDHALHVQKYAEAWTAWLDTLPSDPVPAEPERWSLEWMSDDGEWHLQQGYVDVSRAAMERTIADGVFPASHGYRWVRS